MATPTFTIDGQSFSTLEEFYDEVSRKLVPGVYWGRNLDAFNDILRGGFGTPEGSFTLVWTASDVSRERLGYTETVRQLEHRLERCHRSNLARVEAELNAARRSQGATVFDWLIEIIRERGTIELRLE